MNLPEPQPIYEITDLPYTYLSYYMQLTDIPSYNHQNYFFTKLLTYLALSLAPIHKPYQSYCLSTLHLPTYLTPTCNLPSLDEEGEHFRRDTERQALFQLEKAKTKPGKSCQQVSLLSRSVRWCQPDQPGHSFRLELHTTIIGLFSSKVSHGLFRSV